MRGILTATVGFCIAGASFAQQDPQLTQYMFDRLSVNPAVAGTSGQICATGFFRQQWTGFDGAPKTALFNAQMPINKISSGVGLSIYLDELGQQKSNFARLSYSFHRRLKNGGTFGIGLSAGLLAHTLGNNWIARDNPADDTAIPVGGRSDSKFDLGAGLYYTSKKFWIGLSATHLTEPELKDVSITGVRHYFVQAGYNWAINGDQKYVLQPSTMIKSDGTSTQVDLNATFLYNNQVWLGVGYRTEDAIAPMVGYQFVTGKDKDGMARIGYSYDVTTSRLKNYSSGTHEIMVSYCFLLKKKETLQIYKNVRFL